MSKNGALEWYWLGRTEVLGDIIIIIIIIIIVGKYTNLLYAGYLHIYSWDKSCP
jgi:hypothetical protein